MTQAAPLDPPPRKARLQRGLRNLRRAYRSVFGLVVFVFIGWALLDGWRLFELTYRTLPAEGTILQKTPAGPNEQRVTYTFTPPGTDPITDTAIVPPELYQAIEIGQAYTVVYMPNNPAEHWLGDNQSARVYPRFMLICHGLAALIALVVLGVIEYPLRRQVWLARHGSAVQGQIVATGIGRRKRARPWVRYSFRTQEGATFEGKSFLPRATPAEMLAVGQAIEVVYDPTNPRWNRARAAMTAIDFSVEPHHQ